MCVCVCVRNPMPIWQVVLFFTKFLTSCFLFFWFVFIILFTWKEMIWIFSVVVTQLRWILFISSLICIYPNGCSVEENLQMFILPEQRPNPNYGLALVDSFAVRLANIFVYFIFCTMHTINLMIRDLIFVHLLPMLFLG